MAFKTFFCGKFEKGEIPIFTPPEDEWDDNGGDGGDGGDDEEENTPPIAEAGPDQTHDIEVTFNFNGDGSFDADGDDLSYSWNFGDGSTDATGIEVSHKYTVAGSYIVTLTVDDGEDIGVDTLTATVTENQPPVAVARGDDDGLIGKTVSFDGLQSSDPDHDISELSFFWNFGDGNTAGGVEVTHVYNAAGEYTVTLIVTDPLNLSDSDTTVINITDPRNPFKAPPPVIGGKSTFFQFQGGPNLELKNTNSPTKAKSDIYNEAFTFLPIPPDNKVYLNTNQHTIPFFADKVHESVNILHYQTKYSRSFSRFYFDDLTEDKLFISLKPQFIDNLSKLRSASGKKLSIKKILKGLKRSISSGDLSNYNYKYFDSVVQNQKLDKTVRNRIKSTDSIDLNFSFALDYSMSFGKLLKKDEYTNPVQREKARLFKPLASNIFARLSIILEDLTSSYLEVTDDDTLVIDGYENLPINDGWTVTIDNKPRMPLLTELDHSYVLSNSVKESIFSVLKNTPNSVPNKTRLRATVTKAQNTEFDHSTTTTFNNHYVFKIDGSSHKTYKFYNKFLKEKTANYTLMDSADVQSFVRFKRNHRIFPIDVHDPIWHYILENNSLELYTNTFTTDIFDKTNKKLPIIIESLPPYIILVPTNNIKYNPFVTMSEFIRNPDRPNRFIRELKYKTHFDPKINSVGFTHPLFKEELTYPNIDIDGKTNNPHTRRLVYESGDIVVKDQFIDDTQPTTKRKSALRVFTEIINFYDNSFKIPNNTLTWFDLLSRVNATTFYKSELDFTEDVKEELAEGNGVYGTSLKLIDIHKNDLKSTREVLGDTPLTTLTLKTGQTLPISDDYPKINKAAHEQNLTDSEKTELGL